MKICRRSLDEATVLLLLLLGCTSSTRQQQVCLYDNSVLSRLYQFSHVYQNSIILSYIFQWAKQLFLRAEQIYLIISFTYKVPC